MTPKQLGRRFEAERLRRIDEYKRDYTLAYNHARCYAMVRSKKGLPPLQKLLSEVQESKTESGRQTPQQMKAMLAIVSQQNGIPLRKAAPRGH